MIPFHPVPTMDVPYYLDTARLAGPCCCSVTHEVKNDRLPGSEAVLPHHWAHRSALETLLLRLCVTSVKPATSGLALR